MLPASQIPGRMARIWQIMPLVSVATILALVIAAAGLTYYSESSFKAQKIREGRVSAQILATTVTAALAFDDAQATQEYVDALRANPEVFAAGVYDEAGALVAGYKRSGTARLPSTAPPPSTAFEADMLLVTTPAVLGRTPVGTVHLRFTIEPLPQRLTRYAGIMLPILMAAVVLAVLGAAQAALRQANRELAARAQQLSDANAHLHTQIQEREKAEEALRQAQKMETIGQLTGGVAHDFNNLLTIILGNLARLERRLADGTDPDELRRIAQNASRGAQRAATLTRSLLAFSRRQPLDPKPVNVGKLVANMADLLARTLGEQVTVRIMGMARLWLTLVDPNQLENAILNLAVNARDAMNGSGELTIESTNIDFGDGPAVGADAPVGQHVVIRVHDNGGGMSDEVLARAFEPFFTTKDVGHGTGLGLSQVYGFVIQSGGHVSIESTPGKGTTVQITLPRLLTEAPPVQAAPELVQAVVRGSGEVVLVVEDEEAVRENSTSLLTELGYRVLQAVDGPTALRLLDERADVILLFTDVGLPSGMNGRQLADEACRRRPGLKVLFTTGYARDAIIHDGRLDPGVRLLNKPYSLAELSAAIRDALEGAPAAPTLPALLIVEDEPMISLATAASLEEMGFQVAEAVTAAQAVARVQSAPGTFRAALIDIGLPDRRGDDLAAEFRRLHPSVAILITSGYADPELRTRFATDRRVRFVGKPYEIPEILAALEELGITHGR